MTICMVDRVDITSGEFPRVKFFTVVRFTNLIRLKMYHTFYYPIFTWFCCEPRMQMLYNHNVCCVLHDSFESKCFPIWFKCTYILRSCTAETSNFGYWLVRVSKINYWVCLLKSFDSGRGWVYSLCVHVCCTVHVYSIQVYQASIVMLAARGQQLREREREWWEGGAGCLFS